MTHLLLVLALSATLRADGLRVTWPGAGPACVVAHGRLIGCGTGGAWAQGSVDESLRVRVGEVVEVRTPEGRVLGRVRVRGVTYLPMASTKRPPR